MNRELAVTVIRGILARWPSTTIGSETTEAWATDAPDVTPEVADEALRRLAKSDSFAPSIARFCETVKLLERENTQPAVASGVATSDSVVAAERMRFIFTYWLDAAKSRPDCDHRDGHDACPRCSTSKAWVDEHQPQVLALLADEVPMNPQLENP